VKKPPVHTPVALNALREMQLLSGKKRLGACPPMHMPQLGLLRQPGQRWLGGSRSYCWHSMSHEPMLTVPQDSVVLHVPVPSRVTSTQLFVFPHQPQAGSWAQL
jgi:hypothetical protein